MAKFLTKIGFYAKKYAPEILTTTGVLMMASSTIAACFAVPKAQKALKNAEEKYETIEVAKQKAETDEKFAESYTEEDYANDRKIVSVQTTKDMILVYALPFALAVGGASFIFTGMGIMRARYTALTSAYTALNVAYEQYRKRVAAKYGEEEEYNILHDIHEEVVQEEVVDPETGEGTTKAKVKKVAGAEDLYTFMFDSSSPKWDPDIFATIRFLEAMQAWAHNLLLRRGYVSLKEVLENLGITPTAESFEIGWVYDLNDPHRDNFISFGEEANALFENTSHADVIEKGRDGVKLRFNPDGCISYLFPSRM